MAALSDYLTDTRRLLRDEATAVYSTADLTAFINRAMQQRDLDLGMNRSRIRRAFVVNQFEYTFADIIASGTVLDGAAAPNLVDLISVTVVTVVGATTSGVRYPLARKPYSWIAYLLSVSWPSYPRWYAVYGPSTVFVAPPPAVAYPVEWDFRAYATALVNTGDADPLPYPWTDPVPFLAAHFAKVQSQRPDEASAFLGLYRQRLALVRAGGRPLAVPDPFFDMPRGAR